MSPIDSAPLQNAARVSTPAAQSLPALRVLVFVIILVAALIRLHNLGSESFTTDEAVQIVAADPALRLRLDEQPAAPPDSTAATQPPLLALLTGLTRRCGSGEFMLRLPGAVAGTATLWAAWRLGVLLFETEGALYATALLAFSPLLVSLSRTVAPEVCLTLLATLAVLTFCRAVAGSQGIRRWVLFATVGALASLSAYAALLVLAALALWSLATMVGGHSLRPRAAQACVATLLAAIPGVLWLVYSRPHVAGSLLRSSLDTAFFLRLSSLIGIGSPVQPLFGVSVLACAVLGAAVHPPRRVGSGLLVVWVLCGVGGVLLACWWLRLAFQGAQVAFAVPAYALLAGHGLAVLRQTATSKTSVRVARATLGVLLLLILLIELPLLARSLHERQPRWRDAAALVARNAHHDDAIVALFDASSLLLYAPDLARRVTVAGRPAIVPAYFVHPERSWLVAPSTARLNPGWKRIDNWLRRFPYVNISPGPGVEVLYTGRSGREDLLREIAFFDLPTPTLVRGDLLLQLFRTSGPVPPLLWKVDQIALAHEPLDLRNPDLLNVVYYLAQRGHGDRAASLAYRLATAEPDWKEAQQALAAFQHAR